MSQPGQTPSTNSSSLIPALLLFGGLTLLLMALFSARPSVRPGEPVAMGPTTEATAEVTEAPTVEPTVVEVAANVLDPAQVAAGESIFQTTCAACHGFTAQGVPGLGKPLVNSEFVNSLTDEEFLAFLHVGRDVTDPANTTGMPMPAKGGNPGLTDNDLMNVIAYIHSLNQAAGDAATAQPTAAPTAAGPTATPYVFVPLPLSSGAGTGEATGEASADVTPTQVQSAFGSAGEALFVQTCAGCHGVDGSGVAYLTAPLSESALLAERNGFGLQTLLLGDHPPMNPEQGFQHPYRGGYPQLTDQQIQDVIVYLYSLPAAP